MFTRIFGMFALAFALFSTECWAQESNTCFGGDGLSCTNTFSPGVTTGTYDFNNDGRLTVQFDTVLTTFTLTVTVNHTIDPIDFTVFPPGTVCVQYAFNGNRCDQYDFTGNAGGPNGVPVKNVDYQHLITLTLSYLTFQTTHTPAFGHAPGDITTFTEDILTGYSSDPVVSDPTINGKGPGLSSVVALDEPLTGNGTICNLTLNPPGPVYSAAAVPVIEITFQLFNNISCSGTALRDKTARLSLSYDDPATGNVVFPPIVDKEEGGKFHWDNKAKANEYDLSTVGLPTSPTGLRYTITVFSNNASPQSTSFVLAP